jgi:hypothetical protein
MALIHFERIFSNVYPSFCVHISAVAPIFLYFSGYLFLKDQFLFFNTIMTYFYIFNSKKERKESLDVTHFHHLSNCRPELPSLMHRLILSIPTETRHLLATADRSVRKGGQGQEGRV